MTIELAPEIEAGLRAEAAVRGVKVDALVDSAVRAYLHDAAARPSAGLESSPFSGRAREMAWAAHPDAQFFGKWVVLQGSDVVASGPDPKVVYEEVRAGGLDSPFLIFVSPHEQEPFAGGWMD